MENSASLPGPEALLEHSAFLHRLARTLVFDAGQAEDVVQEALRVALQRRPRRGLRAFLAGITRNLARQALRGGSRRARRERAAARPEGLPSAADVAERLELERRVVAAVHALEEPYRSTIVHRYFDGRTPTEIARRLDLPVRTVETRLRRGIERLREQLDAAVHGDRRAWSLGLVPVIVAGRSRDALWGGGAFLGASMVTAKTIGIGAALAATAFFAGWALRAVPEAPSRSSPRADAAVEGAFQAREEDLRKELAASSERIAALEGENRKLRDEAAAVAAAPAKPAEEAPAVKGPRFVFGAHDEALQAIDWRAAGESLYRMGPLLEQLKSAMEKGEPIPATVGEIQRWNGPLVTMALTLQQNGVEGTEVNGTFTHPSVLVNAVYGTLLQAKKPLSAEQEAKVSEIGHRYVDEDRRRLAAYAPGTLGIRKVVDEADLKERCIAEIERELTPEQREILHPSGTRGWTNLDLFSSGIMLGPLVRPVPFADRATLATLAAEAHARELKLAPEMRAALDAIVQPWVAAIPEEFLVEEMTPIAGHLMVRVERARESAKLALKLREAIATRLTLTAEQRAALERLVTIPVPLRRQPD